MERKNRKVNKHKVPIKVKKMIKIKIIKLINNKYLIITYHNQISYCLKKIYTISFTF